MTIETKYNINDEVYTFRNGKLVLGHIIALNFRQFLVASELIEKHTYWISSEGTILYDIDEIDIFSSKEEFLNNI